MNSFVLSAYNYFFNADKILVGRRLSWIDYAKGIAIFLVVYHHAFLGLQSAGLKVNMALININMIVYSFRVPLFFILSGLFIQRGVSKRGIKEYITYRARILLYPYILWAVLQIGIQFFFQSYANSPWRLKLFLDILYEPKNTGQLWYLLALFNASVLYVWLYTKWKMTGKSHLVLGGILYLLAPVLSFNSLLQQLSTFYIYLALGTQLSAIVLNEKNNLIFGSLRTFLLLLPFFLASQYYFLQHEDMDPAKMSFQRFGFSFSWLWNREMMMIQYFFIVLIGCAITVNICFMLQKWGRFTFLRVIGYHSLYIYLMHLFLLVMVRTFFVFFLHYNNTFIILPVQIIIAVLGSIIIYNIFRRLNLNFFFEYDPADLKKLFRRFTWMPKYQKT